MGVKKRGTFLLFQLWPSSTFLPQKFRAPLGTQARQGRFTVRSRGTPLLRRGVPLERPPEGCVLGLISRSGRVFCPPNPQNHVTVPYFEYLVFMLRLWWEV